MSLNLNHEESPRRQYGATMLRWKGSSVFALMKRVFDENKTAGKDEVARRFGQALLRGDDDLIMDAATYMVTNNWQALVGGENAERLQERAISAMSQPDKEPATTEAPARPYVPRTPRPPQPSVDPVEAKAAREAKISAAADAIKQIVLMDQIMPNGKKRGDCRGTELVKFGGADIKIGKKAGAKLVRTIYDENDLRKAFGLK
jgi:hypothetical protein